MSILSSVRKLSDSAQTLSVVALDNADVIPVTADSVRMASRQVSDAAESVKDLADLVKGLVMAVAIGWTVGTLIGAVMKLVGDVTVTTDPWKLPGLSKQTLER